MLKEAIGTGSTIDEAKENAILKLGARPEDDVKIEVLANAKKKSFGLFGGAEAKVKASIEVEDVVEEKVEETKITEKEIKNQPKKENSTSKSDLKEGTPEYKAVNYLSNILDKLGCTNVEITVTAIEGGSEISVEGEGLGVMIGHRGETLDAIQHLTSLAANVGESGYYRIVLNTGDYRQKREQTLINLAKRMSAQAIKTGKCRTLEPMNPYERRIIHTAVQAIDGVTSTSFGEGSSRRVVIAPNGVTPKPRNEIGRRGRNSNRIANVQSNTTSHKKISDAADIPLYSKIEL